MKDDLTRPVCAHCNEIKPVKLRRKVDSSGVIRYMWWCLACNWYAKKEKQWLPKRAAEKIVQRHAGSGMRIDLLPIISDDRKMCEVCDSPAGAEEHHWAPKSLADLFGEIWPLFPTAYLCKRCHDLWHEIVTPEMPGRGMTDEAKEAIRRWRKDNERAA